MAEDRRAKRLREVFNVTPEERDALVHGLCPICGVRPAAYLDHEHRTGLVRGGLCFICNRLLGLIDHYPAELAVSILRNALEYLLHPPATAILGAPRFGLIGEVGTKKQNALIRKLRKTGAL